MMPETDLEATVNKAIVFYNRLRPTEIAVKLVVFAPPLLTVSFTGGFCYGCGIHDYVESFANHFKMLTEKYELKADKTREIDPRTFEADYTIKSK
jgi:hypothetical protein